MAGSPITRCGLFVLAMLCAAAAEPPPNAAPPEATPDLAALDAEALLELVRTGHERNRAAIKSIEYRFTVRKEHFVHPRGPRRFGGDGRIIRRGELVNAFYRPAGEFNDRNQMLPNQWRRAILTDTIFVEWPYHVNPVVIHSRTPDEPLDRELDMRLSTAVVWDMFVHGFGNGNRSLPEMLAYEGSSWLAAFDADSGMIVLEESREHGTLKGPPYNRYTVDPERGYLITSHTFIILDSGAVGMTREFDVDRAGGDGPWVCTGLRETRYLDWMGGEAALDRMTGEPHADPDGRLISSFETVRVTDVRINEEILDETFTLNGMPIPDGQSVVVEKPDGTFESRFFFDGEMVSSTEYRLILRRGGRR